MAHAPRGGRRPPARVVADDVESRFAVGEGGHLWKMPPADHAADESGLPMLVFMRRRRCGTSRKMESLVAWVKVTQKRRLRVVSVDAEEHPEVAEQLHVEHVPSLVLVKQGEVVGTLEGRSTGKQISDLIGPHLDPEEG